MKNEILFRELIFLVAALIIGFVLTYPRIQYDNIEYGVCIQRASGSFGEWLGYSFLGWLILKMGQSIGRVDHDCEVELQRKKDRESNLLEKKRDAVLRDHIEAVELGMREPDETYYRYWHSNHSSKPSLDTIKQQESQEQKRLEERKKKADKMAEAIAGGIRESKDKVAHKNAEAIARGIRESKD